MNNYLDDREIAINNTDDREPNNFAPDNCVKSIHKPINLQ